MTAPITITYHEAVKHEACADSLDGMRESDHVGGDWGTFGRDKPIPLTVVWDVLGESDMWWSLESVRPDVARLLASDFAAHVHQFFDRVRPDDTRPRDAISVARAWDAAWAAAGDAAWAAAWDAAWAAAGDAAWAAAWAAAGAAAWAAAWDAARAAARAAAWAAAGDAEREWQTEHIRAVLAGERAAGEVEITMHVPEEVTA